MLRAGYRQLTFAFADSPSGSSDERTSGELEGKSFLLRTVEDNKTDDSVTRAVDDSHQLLERAASRANLAHALLNVSRNKGAAGVDGHSVDEVVACSPQWISSLQAELLSGRYRPGEIRRVWIPKPGGGKRGLGIPNVVDRVVQQAIIQVLEPLFEPCFHDSSHGFRPLRGATTAIAQASRYLLEGYTWTVDIDLSKFFDRVHHQRLLARLATRIVDKRILQLVHRMLKAKVVLPDGTSVTTPEGTPQGGPLSPLLSNIVLDELDKELERRGLRFVRYADDFSVFVRSERAGRRVMDSIRQFIERRLRLVVNEEKSFIRGKSELTFLGFQLGLGPDGKITVGISRRTKKRMDLKIRELTPRTWGQSLSACFKEINVFLKGWIGYFRLCTEDRLMEMRKFDAHIRRRIRAIILRQKKRPQFLYRHLVARDVAPKYASQTAYRRQGIWRRSISHGIHHAYPNAWFSEQVETLEGQWYLLNRAKRVLFKQTTLFET